MQAESYSHGGRAWIAKLTGLDSKYGFAREFARKCDITSAKTNVYRKHEHTLAVADGDLLQWTEQQSSGRKEGGYLQVVGNGTREISQSDATLILRDRAAATQTPVAA